LPQQEIVNLLGAHNQLERVNRFIALIVIQRQVKRSIAVQRDREIRIRGLDPLVVQHLDAVIVRKVDEQEVQRLLRSIAGLQCSTDDFPLAVLVPDVDRDLAMGVLVLFVTLVTVEQFAKSERHIVRIHPGRVILQDNGPLPGGDLLQNRKHVLSGLLRVAFRTLNQPARLAERQQIAIVFGAQCVASSFRHVCQQGNAQRAIVGRRQKLLERLPALGVAFEMDGQWRYGQGRDLGLKTSGRVGFEVEQFQVAFLRPDLRRRGMSSHTRPVGFRVQRQFDGLVRIARQAVERAAIDSPTMVLEVDAEAASEMRRSIAKESSVRRKSPVGLELRLLIVGPFTHGGAAPHEQVGVRNVRAGFVQHFEQRAGKHAAMVFAFPRLLDALTSGEQDVTTGRDLKWFSLVVKLRVVAVQVAFERSLGVDFVRLPRLELRNVIRISRR
jgi:hypothetical protein